MAFIAIPAAFVLFIWSVILLFRATMQKCLRLKQIALGALLLAIIYIAIFGIYYFSESAYGLGAAFMFPFFMVIVPTLTGLKLGKSGKENVVASSNIFFVCAVASGVLLPIFFDYTIGLPQYLGIPLYY